MAASLTQYHLASTVTAQEQQFFDIWTFPQNYPLILWNDARTRCSPFLAIRKAYPIFFSVCIYLPWCHFGSVITGEAHSHTVTDLWCRRPQYVLGDAGMWAIFGTYARSLCCSVLLQVGGTGEISVPIYHFLRPKDFCHPFHIFHWNREYHGIEWDTVNTHTHSHPNAGLLRRIRSMVSLHAIILESIWFLGTQFTRHCLFLIGPIWRISC